MLDTNLRILLDMEAPVYTPDGSGGQDLSFDPIAQIWCSVTPIRMRLVDGAGGSVARQTVQVLTRAAGVNADHRPKPGYRLRNAHRSYIIEKVEEVQDRETYLELTAFAEVTQ